MKDEKNFNDNIFDDDCTDEKCSCKGHCLDNAEYLYEFFRRKGLIDKLREKRQRNALRNGSYVHEVV